MALVDFYRYRMNTFSGRPRMVQRAYIRGLEVLRCLHPRRKPLRSTRAGPKPPNPQVHNDSRRAQKSPLKDNLRASFPRLREKQGAISSSSTLWLETVNRHRRSPNPEPGIAQCLCPFSASGLLPRRAAWKGFGSFSNSRALRRNLNFLGL